MKLAAGNPNLMKNIAPVAKPRTFNHVKDGQVYVPEKSEPVRAGAMDAFKVQSRGYRT
jgi:hypothetical protein